MRKNEKSLTLFVILTASLVSFAAKNSQHSFANFPDWLVNAIEITIKLLEFLLVIL